MKSIKIRSLNSVLNEIENLARPQNWGGEDEPEIPIFICRGAKAFLRKAHHAGAPLPVCVTPTNRKAIAFFWRCYPFGLVVRINQSTFTCGTYIDGASKILTWSEAIEAIKKNTE